MLTIQGKEGWVIYFGRFLALYKGIVPKIMRLGPGGAIMLLVYEYMHDYLVTRWNSYYYDNIFKSYKMMKSSHHQAFIFHACIKTTTRIITIKPNILLAQVSRLIVNLVIGRNA